MYDYIIIGNGIAGFTAAKEIRENNEDKTILIISKENYHTYWRTRLSDLISKDFCIDDTLVKKETWYEENKIEEKLGVSVEKIDKENKEVILEDGQKIKYDKLLIATGSHCFVPPIENVNSKGVFAIRTLDDLIGFKEAIKDKKKVIIIGGGLLGLEAAYSITKLGLEVLVIESMPSLLSRQLDLELSTKIKDELEKIGIKAVTGKNTNQILEKDGKAYGVELADGSTYQADAIIIQAGVRANIEVGQNSGLKTERGICVNESLVTEDKDIYVAGDCAQIGNVSMGLWTASQEMGKIAANNMTGSNQTYQVPKPFTSLLLGDLKVFSAGITSGEGIEEIKKEDGDYIYKLFKKDKDFVGGILWKNISYQNDIKKIVFQKENPANTKLGKEVFNGLI